MLLATSCERPTAPNVLVYADRPISIPATALGWSKVSVGASHTCGIRTDGSLYCWGANDAGQLGVGTARGKCGTLATPCEGGPRAVSSTLHFSTVSAGQEHTCAITTTRALYCWGDNTQFQTGVPSAVAVTVPTPVAPALQFIDVGAGATHTCAVRTNGVVYCWGEGTLGALGTGDTVTSVTPAPVAGSTHFVEVRSGRLVSCAIATDGSLWCWGSEWEGASNGFDFFHSRSLPHQISGLLPVRDVTASASDICATGVDGTTYCWEGNAFAQLGFGTLVGTVTPMAIASTDRYTAVTAGIIQTCGLALDGRALCWGNNSFGQLGVPRPGQHCGDAALECSPLPIAVYGEQRYTAIATGLGNHTCAVTVTSALVCWGLGSQGQLGDGFTRDRQSLPVPVLAPSP